MIVIFLHGVAVYVPTSRSDCLKVARYEVWRATQYYVENCVSYNQKSSLSLAEYLFTKLNIVYYGKWIEVVHREFIKLAVKELTRVYADPYVEFLKSITEKKDVCQSEGIA